MALLLRTIRPKTFGMADLTSFRTIIELWPSREALAADLTGVGASTVSKWWQRDNIPADWWSKLLLTEKAKTSGVTAETLTALAAREEVRA